MKHYLGTFRVKNRRHRGCENRKGEEMKTVKTVKYIGCNDEQARVSACEDPRPWLIEGNIYNVRYVEVHTYHTRIELFQCPGHMFNSVCFEEQSRIQ